MAKIASSCENCIFAGRYEKVEKPDKTAEEIWASKTFWQKVMGDFFWLECEVAYREDRYDEYMNYRVCTRFPKFVRKHKDDLCGEYKVI